MDRLLTAARSREAPPLDEIVHRGRGGDRASIEDLIRSYQTRVAKFVIAETSDRAHYEDLCQTIFVKMVLALPRLREVARFEPWLFQIARNVCRDHVRSQRGFRRLFVAQEPKHEHTACEPEEKDSIARIEKGMQRLPGEQRDLLRLSLQEPRSYDDLAKLSGSTLSSVKSRLWRARANLRELLMEEDQE